jgi:hypothetical protein
MAIGNLDLLNSRPALVGEFPVRSSQIVRSEFDSQLRGVLHHHAVNRGGGHPCPDKPAAFVDSSQDWPFFNGHDLEPGIHRLLGPVRDRHRPQPAALADQIDQTPAAVPLLNLFAQERRQFFAPDAGADKEHQQGMIAFAFERAGVRQRQQRFRLVPVQPIPHRAAKDLGSLDGLDFAHLRVGQQMFRRGLFGQFPNGGQAQINCAWGEATRFDRQLVTTCLSA